MPVLRSVALLAFAAALSHVTAQQDATSPPRKTIDITVEQREGSEWKPVSAQKVFRTNDVVRFRLRSQVPGYLYVMNHESDGVKTWLYPRSSAAGNNYVAADNVYLIPDDKGSFSVGGKPGFDVTYWMISPTVLSVDSGTTGQRDKPNNLLPRCDGPLRARGACEDKQAGPHVVTDPSEVPPAFSASGGLLSRELTFKTGTPGVQVSTPEPVSESIIYALWIAHQ
jgi:hypothetical protein